MTDDISHQAMDEILPWYANGTLEADERDQVERHVAECGECRQELALLRQVSEEAAELAGSTPPIPDTFDKTMALIDDWEQSRAPAGASGWRAFVAGLLQPSGFTKLAFAGQFAVILLLGGLLVASRFREPPFSTLSGSEGAGAGVRLTMTFEPAATEGAMRQALRAAGGVIVSGPSAAGVYVVALPGTVTDPAAVDRVIATLRATSGVVRFVERQP